MYNDVERCENHMDYFATTGDFDDIFNDVLYGYYYGRDQGGERKHLKFTLFFADPFDPVIRDSDGCGFNKKEHDSFNSDLPQPETVETKNMQINPLQYDDWYGGDERGLYPRTVPSFDEALVNNIYYDKRTFFQKLFHKNSYQIKTLRDNSLLYKVTFDLPFDVIEKYIIIDKILRENGNEKVKHIYYSSNDSNLVESLFKKMKCLESNLLEMGDLIRDIRKNPSKYKRNNSDDLWAKENIKDGFNIENAEFLYQKVKSDVEKMHAVLWQARYFDIHAEPMEPEDRKCSHKLCTRDRIHGSDYCSECVQLSTKQCNFCKKEVSCQQ